MYDYTAMRKIKERDVAVTIDALLNSAKCAVETTEATAFVKFQDNVKLYIDAIEKAQWGCSGKRKTYLDVLRLMSQQLTESQDVDGRLNMLRQLVNTIGRATGRALFSVASMHESYNAYAAMVKSAVVLSSRDWFVSKLMYYHTSASARIKHCLTVQQVIMSENKWLMAVMSSDARAKALSDLADYKSCLEELWVMKTTDECLEWLSKHSHLKYNTTIHRRTDDLKLGNLA